MNRYSLAPGSQPAIGLPTFVALFAAITYAALSTRALLNPYEINHFIDAKRILSVLAGTAVLWVALRTAEQQWRQKAARQAIAIVRVSAIGMIALFAFRELYDLAESGEFAAGLAVNIRFMLTWLGYFSAAVAIFLAHGYYRQLQAIRTGSANGRDREQLKTLLTVLRAQTGYESADIDISDQGRRMADIDRMLERLP
jgi:hypothetical protein